ncbi:L-seryl-tRNA(Sec) selenium transferase [Ramlibacter sp. AN1015]|uniref:L-seryl-tRNA(Sec) selenium transferase n=1 Tax=Ramlibacter sp. AN1015 TaxID=3133428 RepID=UPI0030C5AFFD
MRAPPAPSGDATARARQLPSLHQLLQTPAAQALCAQFPRARVAQALREGVAELRGALVAGDMPSHAAGDAAFFREAEARLQAPRLAGLRAVINATGVVLHTNLGRAPLAPEALDAMDAVARGYSNLEYDLEAGTRGSRHAHLEALLCRLSGAEAALVVNNCAAAVLLALTAWARDGEVLVSRGELVEIGGGFRVPDVIAQSGARLVEVGTTNKTRLADYERAIGPATRLILRTHPSNYRVLGFTAQPERAELAALAERHNVPFMEDLGSGTLVDLRRFGLPAEPTVQACVRDGGGLVAFSGDKLLGGPQAGIVVGPSRLVQPLRAHPLARALRIDKLSLAALQATLALYEGAEPPQARVPALRMLAQSQAEIARRAGLFARRLRRRAPALDCTLRDDHSLAGGGALPEAQLPTRLLLLRHATLSADALARRLRAGRPAVVGRVVEDHFALDLRTVADGELAPLLEVLAAAAQGQEG